MFIVVFASLVIQTIIDQGPIIFVSLAQKYSGEIDVFYTAETTWDTDTFRALDYIDIQSHFLNYTKIAETYGD